MASVDEDDASDPRPTLEVVRRRDSVRAAYAAARQAVRLARLYRSEPTSSGRRERESLEEVARLRASIRALRDADRERPGALLPGLRKAEASDAASPGSARRTG